MLDFENLFDMRSLQLVPGALFPVLQGVEIGRVDKGPKIGLKSRPALRWEIEDRKKFTPERKPSL